MKRSCVASALSAFGLVLSLDTAAHATEGRRLGGREIAALLSGKSIVYLRNRGLSRESTPENPHYVTLPFQIKFEVDIRPDGSFVFRCTEMRHEGERPCGRVPKGVGVWEIKGDQFCTAAVGFRAQRAACYEVLQSAPKRIYFKLANDVPSAAEGPVDIK